MRIVGRFPYQQQIGAVVDSLKNMGLDRSDMIISDLAEETAWDRRLNEDQILAETLGDSFWPGGTGAFSQGIKGLSGREGIIVSVEIPAHSTSQVREIMEQTGAVEVVQD